MLFAVVFALATDLLPFNDLGPAPYAYGYYGGLYEDGSNAIPADHLAAGLRRASLIRPLDTNGQPSLKGKVVFLGVGFGETARIADSFSEKQVQAAWIQMNTNETAPPLPRQDAEAYRVKGYIATALRNLKARYPNLQVAYLSSRVYGGYAASEPYAYESALSVRWVILGQVTLMRTGFLWDTR